MRDELQFTNIGKLDFIPFTDKQAWLIEGFRRKSPQQVFRTPARPEGVLWARGAVMSCVKDAPEAAKAPCHMMREERTDFWRSSGRAQTLQILPLCRQSAQAVFQNKLILPIFWTHFGTRRRFPKKG